MKTTKRTKSWWIKERNNPQLGTYYVPCGQLSKTAAMAMERSVYGENCMREYRTEREYMDALEALRKQGENVHPR